MNPRVPRDLMHNLVLPVLLFAALGGMTWAVRGSSGYGAMKGCIFAGVAWGAAWWYLARDPNGVQSRRYASGWIILALTLGVGISGARGWMQWPSFFDGQLQTNASKGEFVPISRLYGFLWLFIAGMPWAGLGACFLAWCGPLRPTAAWQWALRIGCGLGAAHLAVWLFDSYPEVFLPLYKSMKSQYLDLETNPNLRRLIGDSRSAIRHLGFYVGFLVFELGRRDWKNVVLILAVGIINGTGWALLQNWKWSNDFWPSATFNFWRCWESSGGISIGIAYGIAYYLVNRPMSGRELSLRNTAPRNYSNPLLRWAPPVLMLFIALFVRYEMTHGWARELGGRGTDWASFIRFQLIVGLWANLYVLAAVIYQIAFFRLRATSTDDVWPARRKNLDWLATYYGLMTLLVPFMLGEVAGWFGFNFISILTFFGTAAVFVALYYRLHGSAPGPNGEDPTLERWGVYLGLLVGLGLSIKNGSRGWANIYLGNEDYWGRVYWNLIGPLLVLVLIVIVVRLLARPLPHGYAGDAFPHAYKLLWLMLIVQNILAQLITGPVWEWNEVAFSIYYVLLFLISTIIVYHYRCPPLRKFHSGSSPQRVDAVHHFIP
ncbi:MAG: hypothetical protein HYV26_05275 [Candidatus Hydrogenedentes bacterium]|nr:hypothetical protein [Candidatus Hydrogenedentota bacterium]